MSLAELEVLASPATPAEATTAQRRYHAVVMEWRQLFLPPLARILTSCNRDIRLKGALYVLRCVLKLDPLCLAHLLAEVQRQECGGEADDALTPADRRLWGLIQVRRPLKEGSMSCGHQPELPPPCPPPLVYPSVRTPSSCVNVPCAFAVSYRDARRC